MTRRERTNLSALTTPVSGLDRKYRQRDAHRTALMRELLERGEPMMRQELAQATGISLPSISRILRELAEEGFVAESSVAEGAVGRPSQTARTSSKLGVVMGIDLGAQRSRATVSDLSGAVLHQYVETTPTDLDAAAAAEWAAHLVDAAMAEESRSLRQLIVCLPARVAGRTRITDPADEIRRLGGTELASKLSDMIPAFSHLESDSAMSLVAELDRGGAQDTSDVVLITLGRTLTAAVAIGGALVRGATGAAGDLRRLPHGRNSAPIEQFLGSGFRGEGPPDDEFVDALAQVTAALSGTFEAQAVFFEGPLIPAVREALPRLRQAMQSILPSPPELKIATSFDLFSSALGGAILASQSARRSVLADLAAVQKC